MKVRAITNTGEWTFGKGKNNYAKDVNAVAQMIKTRLKSFLGDCFFALGDGIDWFNLNGSKDLDEIKINIVATILNTPEVISANEVNVTLGQNRNLIVQYEVNTNYGRVSNELTQEL